MESDGREAAMAFVCDRGDGKNESIARGAAGGRAAQKSQSAAMRSAVRWRDAVGRRSAAAGARWGSLRRRAAVHVEAARCQWGLRGGVTGGGGDGDEVCDRG